MVKQQLSDREWVREQVIHLGREVRCGYATGHSFSMTLYNPHPPATYGFSCVHCTAFYSKHKHELSIDEQKLVDAVGIK